MTAPGWAAGGELSRILEGVGVTSTTVELASVAQTPMPLEDYDTVVVGVSGAAREVLQKIDDMVKLPTENYLVVIGDETQGIDDVVRSIAFGADAYVTSADASDWAPVVTSDTRTQGYSVLIEGVVHWVTRAMVDPESSRPRKTQAQLRDELHQSLLDVRERVAETGSLQNAVGDQLSTSLTSGFGYDAREQSVRLMRLQAEQAVNDLLSDTEPWATGDDVKAISEREDPPTSINLPAKLGLLRRLRGADTSGAVPSAGVKVLRKGEPSAGDDLAGATLEGTGSAADGNGGGSLYWNNYFPDRTESSGELSDPIRLEVGRPYLFISSIDEKQLEGSQRVDRSEVEGIDARFVVEGDGPVEVAIEGTGAFGSSVASEFMTCSPTGTTPFKVDVRRSGDELGGLTARLFTDAGEIMRRDLVIAGPSAPAEQVTPADPSAPAFDFSTLRKLARASLQLEFRQEGPNVELLAECSLASRPWVYSDVPLPRRRDQINNDVSDEVRKLIELAKTAYPGVDYENSFSLGDVTPEVLVTFAQAGWRAHRAIFGNPSEPGDLSTIARSISTMGDAPERIVLQIRNLAELAVPWGLLYDSHARDVERAGANAQVRAQRPERESVDIERFWGVRFDIYQTPRTMRDLPTVWPRPQAEVTSIVNPGLPADIVARQEALFDPAVAPRSRLRPTAPPLTSVAQVRKWIGDGDPCDVLSWFCHATAPSSVTDTGFAAKQGATDALAQFGLGEEGDEETSISIAQMYDEWSGRRDRRPLVLLHACGSAHIDQLHGNPFVDHFISTWGARAVLGTDWTIPVAFADRFSRRLVEELDAGSDLLTARGVVAAEAFKDKNPWALIYSIWGQPTVALRSEDS